MSSSSSSSNDNSVRIRDYSSTSDHVAESLKNAAKDIHESSFSVRELILTLLRSGAIEEIALAIHEATTAIRDTANEINNTVNDLKQRGIIKDSASSIKETTNALRHKRHTLQIDENTTIDSTKSDKKVKKDE